MNLIRANLRTIIIIAVLAIGILITLYLVQHPRIFKSRADSEKFNVTDKNGAEVTFQDNKYTTTSDHISIGIKDISKFNKL